MNVNSMSRYGEVIDWLITNLDITTEDGPVQLSEAYPGRGLERNSIIIGKVMLEQEWQQFGHNTRNEDLTVMIDIFVHRPGGEAREVRETALYIAGEVAGRLRRDQASITLDGICAFTSYVANEWTPGITDQGRDGVLETRLIVSHIRF